MVCVVRQTDNACRAASFAIFFMSFLNYVNHRQRAPCKTLIVAFQLVSLCVCVCVWMENCLELMSCIRFNITCVCGKCFQFFSFYYCYYRRRRRRSECNEYHRLWDLWLVESAHKTRVSFPLFNWWRISHIFAVFVKTLRKKMVKTV